MGMRPIGEASPSGCGSGRVDSTDFRAVIHDSQADHVSLSAGDAARHPRGESGSESDAVPRVLRLSPIRPAQSRVSPRAAVG